MQDREFDVWMAARVAGLLRFAYLVTGNQHSAEEAVQAALTRIFERWSTVRDSDDVDRYVRRSVVNAHAWRSTARVSRVR